MSLGFSLPSAKTAPLQREESADRSCTPIYPAAARTCSGAAEGCGMLWSRCEGWAGRWGRDDAVETSVVRSVAVCWVGAGEVGGWLGGLRELTE